MTTVCKCKLAQMVVGDGCAVCNPGKAMEYSKPMTFDEWANNGRKLGGTELVYARAAWNAAVSECNKEFARELADVNWSLERAESNNRVLLGKLERLQELERRVAKRCADAVPQWAPELRELLEHNG